MGDTGLEPVNITGCKKQRPPVGGAESGAVGNNSTATDPDLAKVVEAWPRLPEPIKRAILAMIEASGQPG